jgi:hypothetical protein
MVVILHQSGKESILFWQDIYQKVSIYHRWKTASLVVLIINIPRPYVWRLKESLISQIVPVLRRIKDVLLILSSRFGGEEIVVPTFPKLIEMRAKKEFDETKLNLSVYNNTKMKRVSLTENELNGVTS